MTQSTYEPSALEIRLTLSLGLTVLSPYYRSFVRGLNLNGDERVLDFGSGSGICSRHIAASLQRGGHLDCLDVSYGWINVIRKTLQQYSNVSYYLGHISNIDLPDAAFDVIVIHFVLHDIPVNERLEVINALTSKLKTTGRLIVREPQGHNLSLDELINLTATAGLHPSIINARKVAIGQVFDGHFILNKEIS